MKRKNQGISSILVILLLLIAGGFFIYSQLIFGWSTTTCVPSQIDHQSSVPAVWTKKNVYIGKSDGTQLIAVKGKLIYIGKKDFDHSGGLVAVDSITGEVIWQSEKSGLFTLAASNDLLFVGETGRVTAINPDNEKIVWTTSLLVNVTNLLVHENILYVDTTKSYFLLEPETGKIIRSLEYSVDNNRNPDLPTWSDHVMNLEFVNNVSFFQKQIGWPNVTAVQLVATDETIKNQLWSSTLPMIGRAAISPLGIVALDAEGSILIFDVESGTMNELVRFTPSPTRHYECPDGEWLYYGFSVAVDSENHMAFIYLGDGAELFAFKLPM